jgi:hypothetical protein
MAKKHMKKCSPSLAIKKMQIKNHTNPPHSCWNCYNQEHVGIHTYNTTQQMLVRMWGRRNPHTQMVEI